MIVRIGKHEATLIVAPMDRTIMFADVPPFRVEIATAPYGCEATLSELDDEDGRVVARAIRPRAQDAIDEAMKLAIFNLDRRAHDAQRDYECLDVHALNVTRRMRETAEVAERARRLVDG